MNINLKYYNGFFYNQLKLTNQKLKFKLSYYFKNYENPFRSDPVRFVSRIFLSNVNQCVKTTQ